MAGRLGDSGKTAMERILGSTSGCIDRRVKYASTLMIHWVTVVGLFVTQARIRSSKPGMVTLLISSTSSIFDNDLFLEQEEDSD